MPCAQVEQGAEALGDDGGVGHELVPGQHLVGRQPQHGGLGQRAVAAEEEGEVGGQLLGRVLVGGDADDGALQRSESRRVRTYRRARRTHESLRPHARLFGERPGEPRDRIRGRGGGWGHQRLGEGLGHGEQGLDKRRAEAGQGCGIRDVVSPPASASLLVPLLPEKEPDSAHASGPLGEEVLSFRHLLNEALNGFLAGEHLQGEDLAESLGELIVSLSRYREEGAVLFPQVFLAERLDGLLECLLGRDVVRIGSGTLSRETVRLALKACAPLAQGSWCIWLERAGAVLNYGIFRTEASPLTDTPMELLRQSRAAERQVLGVLQLAENIIELCGASGRSRFLYLSGARTDARLPTHVVGDLVGAITRHVERDVLLESRHFFRSVLWGVMQIPHGSLVAVVPERAAWLELFEDGIRLEAPLSPVGRIREEGSSRHPRMRARATSLAALAAVMQSVTGVDGITVFRSDGALLGYNVFIRPESGAPRREAGRRAKAHVRGALSLGGTGALPPPSTARRMAPRGIVASARRRERSPRTRTTSARSAGTGSAGACPLPVPFFVPPADPERCRESGAKRERGRETEGDGRLRSQSPLAPPSNAESTLRHRHRSRVHSNHGTRIECGTSTEKFDQGGYVKQHVRSV